MLHQFTNWRQLCSPPPPTQYKATCISSQSKVIEVWNWWNQGRPISMTRCLSGIPTWLCISKLRGNVILTCPLSWRWSNSYSVEQASQQQNLKAKMQPSLCQKNGTNSLRSFYCDIKGNLINKNITSKKMQIGRLPCHHLKSNQQVLFKSHYSSNISEASRTA